MWSIKKGGGGRVGMRWQQWLPPLPRVQASLPLIQFSLKLQQPSIPDLQDLGVESSELENNWTRERATLNEKLKKSQQELQSAQEKILFAAQSARKSIRELEHRNKELQSEVSSLERQKHALEEDNEGLAIGRGGGVPLKTIQELQNQIAQMSKRMASNAGGGGGGGNSFELSRLREENARLRSAAQYSSSGAAVDEQTEHKLAGMLTRNTVLEEELKNYKTYMKVHFDKLKNVKTERDFWKNKAIELGCPANAYAG